jgi:hypothetical protein
MSQKRGKEMSKITRQPVIGWLVVKKAEQGMHSISARPLSSLGGDCIHTVTSDPWLEEEETVIGVLPAAPGTVMILATVPGGWDDEQLGFEYGERRGWEWELLQLEERRRRHPVQKIHTTTQHPHVESGSSPGAK